MSAQPLKVQPDKYEALKAAAETAELSVDEVFAALRQKEIDEAQCTEILSVLERKRVPKWQRALSSF